MPKTALVFGHSSGLGLALTEKLLNEDYIVIGISRSAPDLKSQQLINISADLSDKKDLLNAIYQIKQQHKTFDVLIFASGTLTAHDIDNLNYDEMEYSYKVNAFAPMIIESELLDYIKRNNTYVVNITSSALVDYYPKFSEYSTSKAALAKFTKDLQKELKDTGARVLDVCPSGFTSNIYKTMSGDKIDRDESKQMKASDLAALIVYILNSPKEMEVAYIYINRK